MTENWPPVWALGSIIVICSPSTTSCSGSDGETVKAEEVAAVDKETFMVRTGVER
jgi:hypothetical protein